MCTCMCVHVHVCTCMCNFNLWLMCFLSASYGMHQQGWNWLTSEVIVTWSRVVLSVTPADLWSQVQRITLCGWGLAWQYIHDDVQQCVLVFCASKYYVYCNAHKVILEHMHMYTFMYMGVRVHTCQLLSNCQLISRVHVSCLLNSSSRDRISLARVDAVLYIYTFNYNCKCACIHMYV